MGGITTVLTALPTILGSVDAVASRRQEKEERKLAERQLAQTQVLQEQQAVASANLQQEQIKLSAAQTEEERKAALKRAVSRQRASFGSQGVGSAGGSAQAVLLGLFEESDAERERREQLDALRLRVVDEDLSQRSALNVLQRTQLQERNRLEKAAARYDRYSNDISRLGKVFD